MSSRIPNSVSIEMPTLQPTSSELHLNSLEKLEQEVADIPVREIEPEEEVETWQVNKQDLLISRASYDTLTLNGSNVKISPHQIKTVELKLLEMQKVFFKVSKVEQHESKRYGIGRFTYTWPELTTRVSIGCGVLFSILTGAFLGNNAFSGLFGQQNEESANNIEESVEPPLLYTNYSVTTAEVSVPEDQNQISTYVWVGILLIIITVLVSKLKDCANRAAVQAQQKIDLCDDVLVESHFLSEIWGWLKSHKKIAEHSETKLSLKDQKRLRRYRAKIEAMKDPFDNLVKTMNKRSRKKRSWNCCSSREAKTIKELKGLISRFAQCDKVLRGLKTEINDLIASGDLSETDIQLQFEKLKRLYVKLQIIVKSAEEQDLQLYSSEEKGDTLRRVIQFIIELVTLGTSGYEFYEEIFGDEGPAIIRYIALVSFLTSAAMTHVHDVLVLKKHEELLVDKAIKNILKYKRLFGNIVDTLALLSKIRTYQIAKFEEQKRIAAGAEATKEKKNTQVRFAGLIAEVMKHKPTKENSALAQLQENMAISEDSKNLLNSTARTSRVARNRLRAIREKGLSPKRTQTASSPRDKRSKKTRRTIFSPQRSLQRDDSFLTRMANEVEREDRVTAQSPRKTLFFSSKRGSKQANMATEDDERAFAEVASSSLKSTQIGLADDQTPQLTKEKQFASATDILKSLKPSEKNLVRMMYEHNYSAPRPRGASVAEVAAEQPLSRFLGVSGSACRNYYMDTDEGLTSMSDSDYSSLALTAEREVTILKKSTEVEESVDSPASEKFIDKDTAYATADSAYTQRFGETKNSNSDVQQSELGEYDTNEQAKKREEQYVEVHLGKDNQESENETVLDEGRSVAIPIYDTPENTEETRLNEEMTESLPSKEEAEMDKPQALLEEGVQKPIVTTDPKSAKISDLIGDGATQID